jgi:hypothetical protein
MQFDIQADATDTWNVVNTLHCCYKPNADFKDSLTRLNKAHLNKARWFVRRFQYDQVSAQRPLYVTPDYIQPG